MENKNTGMVSLTERVPPIHTLSPAPKRGANYPAGFCARIRRAQPNRTHHREEVPRELRGCASFALRSRVFFFSEYLSCHELRSTVRVTIWYQRRPLSESSPSPLFSWLRRQSQTSLQGFWSFLESVWRFVTMPSSMSWCFLFWAGSLQ